MAVLDAQGTTFTIDDGGDPGSAVTVGGITSFSGFDGEAADIDITTLSSTAMEYRQGLRDFGNISLELMRDPNDAGQTELDTARAAQEARECVLTLPSGDIATFNAYVKSITASGSVNGVVTGSTNLRITGAVTWS